LPRSRLRERGQKRQRDPLPERSEKEDENRVRQRETAYTVGASVRRCSAQTEHVAEEPRATIHRGMRRILLLVAASLLLFACKRHEERLDKNRQAMLDAVTPCPAPATCTAKMEAADRQVSICTPPIDPQSYAPGDVVVVKELNVHNTLGRIKRHRGAVYDMEFADGFTLERSADVIMGRLCR
jgi:hypothetical protein